MALRATDATQLLQGFGGAVCAASEHCMLLDDNGVIVAAVETVPIAGCYMHLNAHSSFTLCRYVCCMCVQETSQGQSLSAVEPALFAELQQAGAVACVCADQSALTPPPATATGTPAISSQHAGCCVSVCGNNGSRCVCICRYVCV